MRQMRQNPARAPYSNVLSTFMCRNPGQGTAPGTSPSIASDAASPSRMQFSPPSS